MNKLETKLMADGMIKYWSVYQQCWVLSYFIPDQELAAMPADERERVIAHLAEAK